MTVDEVIAAVHKTGFRIKDDGDGGATLQRPDGASHVPGPLMLQLKRVKADIIDKWDRCETCQCEYRFLYRTDVGRLCDKPRCPVRTIK